MRRSRMSVCITVLCLALGSASAFGATPVPTPVYHVAHVCGTTPSCFASVGAALDAAAHKEAGGWLVVQLDEGDFYEKVSIRRARTILRGAGKDRTRLYYDAVAETAGRYHRNAWGTPGSATLTIDADLVRVEGLTVENSYDFLKNDALAAGDVRKVGNSQALAVLLDIHSDRISIRDAAMLGYQDTLFANGARAYVHDSLIAGNVDFIFGNGQVLIEDSEIRTRPRTAFIAPGDFHAFVVAPSTQSSQRMGIVFYRSRLTREDGVPDNSVALGRPWHPTTSFADGRYADPNAIGQASFIDCFMDAHIHVDHWAAMNGTARDGSKTALFRPQDSRFSETGSSGPGARHTDIGIAWRSPLSIDGVRDLLFTDWPQPSP